MANKFDAVKHSIRDGLQEGMMAGINVNCYKGLKYSIQAGVEEAALHMFTNGSITIEFIEAITGLSTEKIKTLNKDNFYRWCRKNPLRAFMYTENDDAASIEDDPVSMSPIGACVKVAIEVSNEEMRKEKYGVEVTSSFFDRGMETGMEQVAVHMIKKIQTQDS